MLTAGFIVMFSVLGAATDVPAQSWSELAGQSTLGPVVPSLDLRHMLNRYIMKESCRQLDAIAAKRRESLAAGTWQAWRDEVRAAVLNALGPMAWGEGGPGLNTRFVSRHERPGYVIENVLFESLPGMDVNASVYLPLAAEFPPPWPAIVVPVGHSAKTRESYQIPAQVFARCGYAALTFDPPGMGGEKRDGNDHFTDGVRCYLTGHSSNRYFVIDALRCIDYLATREDIAMDNGVGMTGVSGGGYTTMFATLLDARIAASGPSCCAVPFALHPVLDNYPPCAETCAPGRMRAYDDIDLLVAAMPTPVLLMAGAGDEVFTEAMSRSIADEVAQSFASAGETERFRFFLDPGGHAYTIAMALDFVKWMDRWVRHEPGRALPAVTREELEIAPDDLLACHPRQDVNMRSSNRDLALALRENRSGIPVAEAAAKVAHVEGAAGVPAAKETPPFAAWFHAVKEVLLQPEEDIELPGTFVYPLREGWRGGAVLYFDDRGRTEDLHTNGMLCDATHFLAENANGPAVFTVDLRGWGDTRPAFVPYDMPGWAARERWLGYVSSALGDHVLAMRIRDGLSALAWLRAQPQIDPARVVVGGRGMGGVVALHVAAIDGATAGAFALESLATFESLCTAGECAYPHDAYLADVLLHYDLPDLAGAIRAPVLIASPRGANGATLSDAEAEPVYAAAKAANPALGLDPAGGPPAIVAFVQGK